MVLLNVFEDCPIIGKRSAQVSGLAIGLRVDFDISLGKRTGRVIGLSLKEPFDVFSLAARYENLRNIRDRMK